jgi:glycosyltransferase involved in cell wall biosynthesis
MEEYIGIDNQGFPQKRIITQQERQKFEEIIEIKLGALKNVSNLTIVSLCNWMQNEVKRNSIFKDYRVELIPNGIDSSIFKPRNQDYSKELFGIPQNKTVLLFVADSLNNKRKGFEFILRAIEQLDKNKFVLVTIGFKYSGFIKFKNIIQLGKIKEELLLSIVYSAADVFIIPSLIDNLPNTVIESLMCGTPVIGFPVGGIPDMIQNGKNGYLTEEISVMSLVETIHLLANTIHNFDRDKISKEAILKYAIEIQSENYISLFKEILKT